MGTGFSLAGQPIAQWKQRESSVRPRETKDDQHLQPLHEGESGGPEAESDNENNEAWEGGNEEQIEELDNKYQQLKDKVEEYFDDGNGTNYRTPPMVMTPKTPTRREYELHQITHTPFAPWCKHCMVARAVRSKHPAKGRRAIIVPDTEGGKGL